MSASVIDIGALNRRLTLEQPVEADDGAGGIVRSYGDAATLWASVVPIGAGEAVSAGALGANVSHRIRIRFRADLTTRHRLRDGATLYRIVALRVRDKRFLDIDAEQRVE